MSTADGEKSPTRKKKKSSGKKNTDHEVKYGFMAGNAFCGVLKKNERGIECLSNHAKYIWGVDGTQYEGDFKENQINGYGRFHWTDGSRYEGDVKDGFRHGSGTFWSASGKEKYVGQWAGGKRHGRGKLTYDLEGKAYYEGEWQDGKKHGYGEQIWPSGNAYKGQWIEGHMQGEGDMKWSNVNKAGLHVEQVYEGSWKFSKPDGDGQQTWKGPAPPTVSKAHVVQQQNNRYNGQWLDGMRDGFGNFFYANGASYEGQWSKNVKHGVGKFTKDNGHVLISKFEGDAIAQLPVKDSSKDSNSGDKKQQPVLNIGGADNPIRQLINIKDLECFNQLVSPHKNADALRETYNCLLRVVGEVKNAYYKYRTLFVGRPKHTDPFVMTTLQFWAFLRDYDLVTPAGCTLAKINRCFLAGERQLTEMAPEALDTINSAIELVKKDMKAEIQAKKQPKPPPASKEKPKKDSSKKKKDKEAKQVSIKSGTKGEIDLEAGMVDAFEKEEEETEDLTTAGNASVPVQSPFSRDETGTQDIHSTERVMLFRHFLEALVRIARLRYPQEHDVDAQIDRLLNDKMQGEEPLALSEQIFGFVYKQELKPILAQYEDDLRQIFNYHSVGAASFTKLRTRSQNTRYLARGFTANQRKAPLHNRSDITMRVKDFMRLMGALGFLELTIEEAELPYRPDQSVVGIKPETPSPTGSRTQTPSAVHEEAAKLREELGDISDLLGGGVSAMENLAEGVGGLGALAGMAGGIGADTRPTHLKHMTSQAPGGLNQSASTNASSLVALQGGLNVDQALAADLSKDEVLKESTPTILEPKDIGRAPLRCGVFELIGILTETLSPQSAEHIRFQARADYVEDISLLDYMEEELVFLEFQRVLLTIADRKTEKMFHHMDQANRPGNG